MTGRCLVKLNTTSPCPKCGKPTNWVYDGRVACLDCLPIEVRHDIQVIEDMLSIINRRKANKTEGV